jgi:hypothetical protein
MVQWLDLSSCLWPTLIGLTMAKKVQVHHDFISKLETNVLKNAFKLWIFHS